jgi:hypothetical protein
MLLFAGTSLPPRIYQSDVETVHRLEEDEFFDLEKRKASGTERFFAALQNDSVRKANDAGSFPNAAVRRGAMDRSRNRAIAKGCRLAAQTTVSAKSQTATKAQISHFRIGL